MYKIPADRQSSKQKRFDVETPAGNTYSLPLLSRLKPSTAARFGDAGTDGAQQLLLLREMFTELAPGLFEEFDTAEQLEGMMRAWQEDSGVTVGESQPSLEG